MLSLRWSALIFHLNRPNLPCCFLIYPSGLGYSALPAHNEKQEQEQGCWTGVKVGVTLVFIGSWGDVIVSIMYVVEAYLCMCTSPMARMKLSTLCVCVCVTVTSDGAPSVVSRYPWQSDWCGGSLGNCEAWLVRRNCGYEVKQKKFNEELLQKNCA